MRDGLLMRKPRNRILVWLTGIALCASATCAAAQSGGTSELRLTLYFWIAGFEGTIGASDSGGQVDTEFSGLLENLEPGGYMLHADWRKGRWTAFGDWSYFNVTSSAPSPFGALYAGTDARIKGGVAQVAGGYQVFGDGDTGVDAFTGLRYYDIEIDMTLQPGLAGARSLNGSGQWVDGIVGARWRGRVNRQWSFSFYGDVGGGGSKFSAQAAATANYEFSWGALVGGWRYLYVDYDSGGMKLEAALSGPFVGATIRF
jgi:hypothetical protein